MRSTWPIFPITFLLLHFATTLVRLENILSFNHRVGALSSMLDIIEVKQKKKVLKTGLEVLL